MYGPFANVSVVGAATGGASADVFAGLTNDNRLIVGGVATGGLGFAASASTTTTNTITISPVVNLGTVGTWIAQQLAPSTASPAPASGSQKLK